MEDSRIRLVAGLGNPGAEYVGTRHNVGFAALDFFAQREGFQFENQAKWEAAVAKTGDTILLKPLAFMNRSGSPLALVADFYKIAPANILIVHDDFALPLGRLRLRPDGGPGGHNGLESIIVHLATEDVPRLRLGIGAAPHHGSTDFVLGRFFEEERPQVSAMIERAVDAIKCTVDNGLVSAMNTFNQEV
ncbi:MAG: aminoacyl-tRNA hydrolase [Verrucomicrobiota bacterium]|nr:aminoacyl-tRNA hydrolase [Verrucomicrobiota bacterium]